MDVLKEVFGMPMFPHIYAIPMTMIIGMAIGYSIRGKVEDAPTKRPRPPQV